MAYDGIFIRASVNEFKKQIIDSKIIKILEPKKNTLEVSLKTSKKIFVLKISTLPNCPFMILCEEKDKAPYHAPAFTMLLKKHIGGGNIINIIQLGGDDYERIVQFEIKNITDLGEIEHYYLYVELMGKYSNVILCNKDNIIIDAMKRSSDNEEATRDIYPKVKYDPSVIFKGIYLNTFKKYLSYEELEDFDNVLNKKLEDIENLNIEPCIIYDGNKAKDFYIFNPSKEYLNELKEPRVVNYNTTSLVLEHYYEEKASLSLFTIEKQNLENIVNNLIEKCVKKIDIKEDDIKKCEKYEIYKMYGELIQAFSYNKNNIISNKLVCENYYDNNNIIEIPLDMSISPIENANKYFNKYNKLKRTIEKSIPILEEEKLHLLHLNSIKDDLNLITNEEEILEIKKEIQDNFHVKNSSKYNKNKSNKTSSIKLSHFISSDNIDIYIGKNNIQNEFLTFKYASNNDTWFHAKNVTGSHVIVKCEIEKIPDKTLVEAAQLAAYFSSKRSESKVEVDYTLKKELKKVKGREPGFCIYHTNNSITVKPELVLKQIS